MGKNDKDKGIDWSLYPEDVTEISNPNFYFGSDAFKLENGDIYIGGYCAHTSGFVWREGCGIYVTKDEHIYQGVWENDVLLNSEDTIIRYPDGAEYFGPVKNNMYSGSGIYILPNKLPIHLSMEQNTPFGEATLIDPYKRAWRGNVAGDFVILRPENHFYNNIPDNYGKGKQISSKKSEEEIEQAESLYSNGSLMRALRDIIFKKTTKTENDFIDSRTVSQSQPNKENTPVSVSSSNEEMCKSYTKPRSSLLKARSGSNVSLIQTFFSKPFRNSCSPMSVFYPTCDKEKEDEIKEDEIKEDE